MASTQPYAPKSYPSSTGKASRASSINSLDTIHINHSHS
jgi:hypothetical protein